MTTLHAAAPSADASERQRRHQRLSASRGATATHRQAPVVPGRRRLRRHAVITIADDDDAEPLSHRAGEDVRVSSPAPARRSFCTSPPSQWQRIPRRVRPETSASSDAPAQRSNPFESYRADSSSRALGRSTASGAHQAAGSDDDDDVPLAEVRSGTRWVCAETVWAAVSPSHRLAHRWCPGVCCRGWCAIAAA